MVNVKYIYSYIYVMSKTIKLIKKEAEELNGLAYMEYIMDEYSINKDLKKSEYKDELLSILDKQHCKNIIPIDKDICENCNASIKGIEPKDSYITCYGCGLSTTAIIDKEYIPTYREIQDIDFVPYFSYQRINHFNDWLNSIQGKENIVIDSSIIQSIEKEIKRLKIIDINHNTLRTVLKGLGLSKYYENISLLLNIINSGNPQITCLTRKQEDILREKFKVISRPYDKHIPPDRKNFLSYSFILRKLCILEGYDFMLKYIPLLKDLKKTNQQNAIWKLICNDLGWKYIPNKDNNIFNYINHSLS